MMVLSGTAVMGYIDIGTFGHNCDRHSQSGGMVILIPLADTLYRHNDKTYDHYDKNQNHQNRKYPKPKSTVSKAHFSSSSL